MADTTVIDAPAVDAVPTDAPADKPVDTTPESSKESWMDWISDDTIKSHNVIQELKKYEEPKEAINVLAKRLVNAQSLIGKKSSLPDDPNDKELLEFRSKYAPKDMSEYKYESENGTLPPGVDDLVKELVNDRKLSISDYQHFCTKLSNYLGEQPENCNKLLEERFGKSQSEDINNVFNMQMNSLDENFKTELMESLGNNPLFRIYAAQVGSLFNESNAGQGTNTMNDKQAVDPISKLQSLETQMQETRMKQNQALQQNNGNWNAPAVQNIQTELNNLQQEFLKNQIELQRQNRPY